MDVVSLNAAALPIIQSTNVSEARKQTVLQCSDAFVANLPK